MARPKSLRVIGFCVFAALGGALFGYDIGVISSCFTMPDFIERFGEQQADGTYVLDANRQSIITSLLGAGTFVGSIAQSFTADLKWGRKGAIFFWSLIFTIGCVVQTTSMTGYAQITAGRFIAGLGVGALSALVPLYNGEAAPRDLRGSLVVLYQVMITIGIVWAYGLDWITHTINGSASWRIPVGFQLVFGVVLCSGTMFLPESPRHCLNYNNPKKAKRSIAKMNNCDLDDPLVHETLADLETMLELENQGGKASWFELLSTNHQMWKRTLNACMIQFVQQLNGQNFFYFYGPTFFAQSGTGLSTYAIQFVLGAVTFAATVPALWFIERLGRRKMLFIGSIGEIICAVIAAAAGHTMLASADTPASEYTSRNTTGGQILVAFAIIQASRLRMPIFFFGAFWGPVPWVISAESFPLRVRSKGIAVATATNWLWNFLLGFFSVRIADDIGPLILLVFAGVLLYGVIYIFFMLPETRNLSLEEVDELYTLKIKPWKSSHWQPPNRRDEIPEVNDKGEVVHRERRVAPMMMGH